MRSELHGGRRLHGWDPLCTRAELQRRLSCRRHVHAAARVQRGERLPVRVQRRSLVSAHGRDPIRGDRPSASGVRRREQLRRCRAVPRRHLRPRVQWGRDLRGARHPDLGQPHRTLRRRELLQRHQRPRLRRGPAVHAGLRWRGQLQGRRGLQRGRGDLLAAVRRTSDVPRRSLLRRDRLRSALRSGQL